MTFTKKLLTLVTTYKFLRKMYQISQKIKETEKKETIEKNSLNSERYQN
jgi:hypothetical protein